jgi:hypothetical protein
MKSLSVAEEEKHNLLPYPYNFTLNVNVFAKYQDDLMQLIEQIVPLFNYHRVFYINHPIFPTITLSNWVKISAYQQRCFICNDHLFN